MAEIDGTNPLTPVWPQRPIRKVEEDEEKDNQRQRQRQEQRKPTSRQEKKKDNDDGSPHIDEYA